MSQQNKDLAWICGVVFVAALAFWGLPMLFDYLDTVCATWRYVVLLVVVAGGIFFLGFLSGEKAAAEFAQAIIPLLLLVAFALAMGGIWWSQNADKLPAFIKQAL